MAATATVVLTDYVRESPDVEKTVGLQAGAPNEVRCVLTGAWPVPVVNKSVPGRTRAGL